MATYLQGVTDATTSLNPPDPGLQFNMQLLQMKQSDYDQSHAKLSKMYGTILNSGLTRSDNIAAREEFFKLVQGDLQKVAGMDLSLDSNVSKAQGVFKQIYTNNYLVKDMVWTKNYQSQQKRADGFKNCVDHTKCGGMYWEDGEKFMSYKREEYKNASADEALGMSDVRYIPYNNMMEEALADLKEMGGFDMTQDVIDGDYIYTTKNGAQVKEPLIALFSQMYQKNPEFHDMYKVMSYNERNDWMYSKMQDGTYKSLNEANVGYIQEFRDQREKAFNERSAEITHDKDELKSKLEAHYEDREAKTMTQAEYDEMQETEKLYESAVALEGYNKTYLNAQKNMHSQQSLNNLSDYLDDITANALFTGELTDIVDSLKNKGYEQTIKLEEKAKMRIEHGYDVAMESIKHQNAINLELTKGEIKAKLEGGKFSADTFIAAQAYENAKLAVDKYDPVLSAFTILNNNTGSDLLVADDALIDIVNDASLSIEQRKTAILKALKSTTDKAAYEAAYASSTNAYLVKQKEANAKALDMLEKSITKGGTIDTPVLYGPALTDQDKYQLKEWAINNPDNTHLQELGETYGGGTAPANPVTPAGPVNPITHTSMSNISLTNNLFGIGIDNPK
jgi:hypothetical protein